MREGFPRGSCQVLHPWLRWGPPPASGSLLSSLEGLSVESVRLALTGPQVGGEVCLVGVRSWGFRVSFVICGASAGGNIKTLHLKSYLEFL